MLDPKDEIKQKIDIVELIGEYLPLKPAGTHGFKAVCPFHSEKSPSFHVSSDRQIWHCFGCSEGGDCFSFVMKMEGMDFPEALMHLGQKVGVEVRRLSTPESNVKQRMLAINDLAAKYYQKVLTESSGAEHVRRYVRERGIPPELIERFGLGFAPSGWDVLSQFLLKRGYRESEIVTAGLGQKRQSGSGVIDRFRERLMIPLRDQHGNTVGFTGRVLPTSSASSTSPTSSPKYMNSPETPVYHKGELVFGLDVAKRAIKEYKSVIIVEGNLDVVASHKAGVEHVVASSGTALTEAQLRLLARYTKTLIFSFDQDAAGLHAAKRGISLARNLGFDVRALILPPDAKDPDELVQHNAQQWKALVSKSVPIMEFLIARVTEGKDLNNVDDKRFVSGELLPALGEIRDVVEQEHWIAVVSDLLGVDTERLRASVARPTDPIEAKSPIHVTKDKPKLSKKQQAWQLLIGLMINQPSRYVGVVEGLVARSIPGESLFELYNRAKILYDSARTAPDQSFFPRLRDEFERETREDLLRLLHETSLLAEKTFAQLSEHEVQQQMNSLCDLIEREFSQQARKELARQIRQAETAGDREAVQRLMQQLNNRS